MDSNFGIPTKGSLKTRRPGDICQKMESGFFHGFQTHFPKRVGGAWRLRQGRPDLWKMRPLSPNPWDVLAFRPGESLPGAGDEPLSGGCVLRRRPFFRPTA